MSARSVDEATQSEAVRLFVERAQAVDRGLSLSRPENAAAVLAICRRLDGLPLAIELAAARIKILPPVGAAGPARAAAAAADRRRARSSRPGSRRCATPSPGATTSSRQEEQALFRRLAVFVGGFTLEAAEQVVRSPVSGDRSATLDDPIT